MVTVLALALIAVAVATVFAAHPFAAVTRVRLDRFAVRQSLPITAENGTIVLRYLATTRRWRGGGLLVSILASVVWSLVASTHVTLGVAGLFAGWFVGAVVAEWRVGQVVDDVPGPRAAMLAPRRLSSYLSWFVQAILAVSALVVLGTEVAALALVSRDRLELVALMVVTIGFGAAVLAVARHVLTRPQPLDAPGVLQADDALRSRSLRVLAGAGTAVNGYLLSITVTVASRSSDAWGTGSLSLWTAVGIIVLPVLGVLVATSPTSTKRGSPVGVAA